MLQRAAVFLKQREMHLPERSTGTSSVFMPCWWHLPDSSIRGHSGYLWIQGHACTCVCDWRHVVLQANLCLPWITEISKSPLLFTQVPFQSPQPAKTKHFV